MLRDELHWRAYGVYVEKAGPGGIVPLNSPCIQVHVGSDNDYKEAAELAKRIAALLEIYKGRSLEELLEAAH